VEKGEAALEKNGTRILIVDDNEEMCHILSHLVRKEGMDSRTATDGRTALELVRSEGADVVMVDVKMPDMNGMEVLRQAKRLDANLPVIMITGHAEVTGAVQAMKAGAHDYLTKPFDNHEVVRVLRRALAERELKRKVKSLSRQLKKRQSLKEIMGPSDAVAALSAEVDRVAASDFSVVIIGETGSGKELVARAVHRASPRSKAPMVPVDCGAIPENLLESELFGYEKGAFTGAERQKQGKFEAARGGTLFLDEIINMSMASQAKLLRVLQDRNVFRVGGVAPVDVDVRVIAACNQDLESVVRAKAFRRDLYYRLNEFTITVPALRQRRDDIPYLAKMFLDTANVELGKEVRGFTEYAIETLMSYEWPGNVRQLRSTIRRAALLADEMITEKHLEMKRAPVPGLQFTPRVQGQPWQDLSLREILKRSAMAVEREIIGQVLKQTGGNKAKAARILKIDYKTMHTKMKTLGIKTIGGEA